MLYYNTNRLAESTASFSQVVPYVETLFGPNHPSTLISKNSLKVVQQALNQSS